KRDSTPWWTNGEGGPRGSSGAGGFDDGRHAAGGGGHEGVGAVGVDGLLLQFHFLVPAGHDDGLAGAIDNAGDGEALLRGVAKDRTEHGDHVLVGVVVV